MTLEIFSRDDLVQVGWTEDGDPDIARRFYLVAEAPNGARWAHDFCFSNRVTVVDPEEGPFLGFVPVEKVEAEIEALRVRIVAHLAAAGTLDPDHWNEVDPAYGSSAYQGLDALGYFRARERQEARDAGEAVPFDEPADAFFAL